MCLKKKVTSKSCTVCFIGNFQHWWSQISTERPQDGFQGFASTDPARMHITECLHLPLGGAVDLLAPVNTAVTLSWPRPPCTAPQVLQFSCFHPYHFPVIWFNSSFFLCFILLCFLKEILAISVFSMVLGPFSLLLPWFFLLQWPPFSSSLILRDLLVCSPMVH